MKWSNSHFLNDMKASIYRIETYIKDMDYEDFLEDDRTYFYIKFNVNPEAKSEDNEKHMLGAQSGDRTVEILEAIRNKSKSTKEIMDEIGIEKKTGSLKRTLKDLLEKGMIEYTIPDKPRSRLQKYRITRKGMNGSS